MPQLPQYQNQRNPLDALSGRPNETPLAPNYGADKRMEARVLEGVAETAKTVVESGMSAMGNFERLKMDSLMQDFDKNALIKFQEAERVAGEKSDGPVDPTQNPYQGFEDWYNEELDKMGSGLFSLEGNSYFNERRGKLNNFYTKEIAEGRERVIRKQAAYTAEKITQDIGVKILNNPKSFELYHEEYRESAQNLVRNGFMSQLDADSMVLKESPKMAAIAWQSKINQANLSPDKLYSFKNLEKELNSGVWDTYFDGPSKLQQAESLTRGIVAEENRRLLLESYKTSNGEKYLQEIKQLPKALDYSPDNIANSFQERLNYIEGWRKRGVVLDNFLFKEEIEGFEKQFSGMKAEDQAALLATIDSRVVPLHFVPTPSGTTGGIERAIDAKEMFAKSVAKAYPDLGVLMGNSDEMGFHDLTTALKGRRIQKSKNFKLPNLNDMKEAFEGTMPGNLLIDRQDIRDGLYQTALNLAIGEKAIGEDTVGEISSEDMKKATLKVTGPILKYGNQSVLSFRKKNGEFADKADLGAMVQYLNNDRLKEIMGDYAYTNSGEIEDWSKAKNRLSLQTVGHGRYWVKRDGISYLKKKDGSFFVLDLKKAEGFISGLRESAEREKLKNDVMRGIRSVR